VPATSRIAPAVADAVYTELATSSSGATAPAADAAWSDFDAVDVLLEDAEGELELVFDRDGDGQ
jgi:hypothetical protein